MMNFGYCRSSGNSLRKGLRSSYGAIRRSSIIFADDDAVSSALKKLVDRLTIVFTCWLISFFMVMVQFIAVGHIFCRWTALLFIPMWTGSFVGILSVMSIIRTLLICENKLSSHEEMKHLQAQGVDISKAHIGYDSLPLLRRLIFWSFAITIFIILASTTQVLFYLWLVEGIIGMWYALLPILILLLLILAYMLVIKSVTILDCFVFSLLSLELVLYGIKTNNNPAINWYFILLPLFVVQLIWAYQLACICIGSYFKTYLLTSTQIMCLCGYVSSLLCAVAAELITCTSDTKLLPPAAYLRLTSSIHSFRWGQFLVALLPPLLWVVAVVVAIGSFLVILHSEGYMYAGNRGHHNPLLLSETRDGWVPVPEGMVFSLLLGSLRMFGQPTPPTSLTTSPSHSPPAITSSTGDDNKIGGNSTGSRVYRGNKYEMAKAKKHIPPFPAHLACIPQYQQNSTTSTNYLSNEKMIKFTKNTKTVINQTTSQQGGGATTSLLRVSEISFLPLAKSVSGDLEGGKDDF